MVSKEYHWFESFDDFSAAIVHTKEPPYPRAACGYFEAHNALKDGHPLIYSDQSIWLLPAREYGYKVFMHHKNGVVNELL